VVFANNGTQARAPSCEWLKSALCSFTVGILWLTRNCSQTHLSSFYTDYATTKFTNSQPYPDGHRFCRTRSRLGECGCRWETLIDHADHFSKNALAVVNDALAADCLATESTVAERQEQHDQQVSGMRVQLAEFQAKVASRRATLRSLQVRILPTEYLAR